MKNLEIYFHKMVMYYFGIISDSLYEIVILIKYVKKIDWNSADADFFTFPNCLMAHWETTNEGFGVSHIKLATTFS